MTSYHKASKSKRSSTGRRRKRTPKRIILVSKISCEIRVAVLEDGELVDFFIERTDFPKLYGNVYKGVVKAVVPGIGAAFVNLGTEKDGFLYLEEESLSEITDLPENFLGLKFFSKPAKKFNNKDLTEGQEVIVQVVKEPIRNKGPRLTRRLSIPGRYIVMVPGSEMFGISRRISNQSERDRIKSIFDGMKLPEDCGIIVRTAGEGQSKAEFDKDVKYLKNKWKQIRTSIARQSSPALVHTELDLVERVIRDTLTEDVSKIIVDSKSVKIKVQKFLKFYMPNYNGNVEMTRKSTSIFEKYQVEKAIERTFRRKVDLKCKGHIVIEQTEALVTVDVNSGKYTGDDNLEETAFRTNCEAAQEIARQARLRDIGGIIILDFIDMADSDHRKEVVRILEEAVKRDRAKTNILQISKLGLVEMTRQRMRPSLESAVYSTCPYCEGRGVVRSNVTMAIRTLRELKKVLSGESKKEVEVEVHPSVAERLVNEELQALKSIEKYHQSKVTVIGNEKMHIEDINISF